MGKLTKKAYIIGSIASMHAHIASVAAIPSAAYDMTPKNSFRGGSRGKGGKIKYRRG